MMMMMMAMMVMMVVEESALAVVTEVRVKPTLTTTVSVIFSSVTLLSLQAVSKECC